MIRAIIIAVLILFVALPFANAQESQRASAPTVFQAEEPFAHPVAIRDDVLAALKKDERTLGCLKNHEKPDEVTAAWFSATEVDLHHGAASGLIVKAENPCLFGANIIPFWVFSRGSNGYALVLRTDALSVELLNTWTNNYRDIRASAATAREVLTADYRFKDGRYQRVRNPRTPIR